MRSLSVALLSLSIPLALAADGCANGRGDCPAHSPSPPPLLPTPIRAISPRAIAEETYPSAGLGPPLAASEPPAAATPPAYPANPPPPVNNPKAPPPSAPPAASFPTAPQPPPEYEVPSHQQTPPRGETPSGYEMPSQPETPPQRQSPPEYHFPLQQQTPPQHESPDYEIEVPSHHEAPSSEYEMPVQHHTPPQQEGPSLSEYEMPSQHQTPSQPEPEPGYESGPSYRRRAIRKFRRSRRINLSCLYVRARSVSENVLFARSAFVFARMGGRRVDWIGLDFV
ncbi:predicted protein [Histoplasma capsulatum G186AR]|uniref:Uncharacterized protein n=1 Tax=Ajellomyces capsulatus (strain G186AR / H82 / ATCC MYA-2454 / RMSCC 2432) TaxID=447093 RepID=C0NZH5_AJECG|nr:uncharacterized protein HCBG_08555 [Histoplasma capsulatum G186AR]EEH03223.1 predicted protein [Histoplasma capsulatum G186AR]